MAEQPFRHRVAVAALTDGSPVPCRVDVLADELQQGATFAWQHDAPAAWGCSFVDAADQATEFLPGDMPVNARVVISVNITLGEPGISVPKITPITITGDYTPE